MKKLIELLNSKKSIDEYKITKTKTSSTELFFIKDELQMNRGKDVLKTTVVVYKNFEENEKKYKGSSSTIISPTMTLDEMSEAIDTASLAASFVKNEYYGLEVPTNETAPKLPSKFSEGNMIDSIAKLVKDLYEENNQFGSFINSTEFFINKQDIRLINSNGIDVSFTKYSGEIELITEAVGKTELIESYDVFYFSDYDKETIKTLILESLEFASLRAKAIPMPKVDNLPVIINGVAAKELWDYYTFNASASAVYNHLHTNKVGDTVQEKGNGDLVSIKLVPYLENSSASSYYDANGTFLKETSIIKDGVIENLIAGKRFAHYLNVPCTGNIRNTVVASGSYTEKELKTGPYLELLKFSDFQSDAMTGNFGGEFRLGIYFDGEKKTPVTLGSISANIKEVQKNMYLSKELIKDNSFIGPKLIKFDNIDIAGN
ncbi:peptidase PmbA [Candidatus Izimaplasma bacterium HR1]|jgi:PmbA protein|uniref:metallopeptidase TldD-related protein n=1 Tax=Candidatus Izimoplasma sp. HR1 TaxID=1541959 RepID=UPI0004F67EDA|nr:peptidase PmbA [Candidatus Izimaplasma bacterium HR1]